jgi:hypothetical protein
VRWERWASEPSFDWGNDCLLPPDSECEPAAERADYCFCYPDWEFAPAVDWADYCFSPPDPAFAPAVERADYWFSRLEWEFALAVEGVRSHQSYVARSWECAPPHAGHVRAAGSVGPSAALCPEASLSGRIFDRLPQAPIRSGGAAGRLPGGQTSAAGTARRRPDPVLHCAGMRMSIPNRPEAIHSGSLR